MVLPALLAVALPAAVQTSPASMQAQYGPGATVVSEATGITFTVPAGFQGAFDATAEGIVLVNGQGQIIGVWGVSEDTIDEVADAVGELLGNAGIQLELAEPPRRGEVTTALFHAATEQGRGYLVAALRQGSSGAVLAVGVLGEDPAAIRATAEGLARDARFGPPAAQQWRQRAAGLQLTSGGASSDYSAGGVGDGSYASQTTARLVLCRSGEYGYEMESESYMSVEGVGGMESTSSDAHQGRWSLVGDLVGRVYLALAANDGREFFWTVEETQTGAVIDGTRYEAGQGPC